MSGGDNKESSTVDHLQVVSSNIEAAMDGHVAGAGQRGALTDYHLDGPLESTSLQADQSNKLYLVQCSQPTNVNVSSMDSQITGAGQRGALTDYHLDGPLESTSLQVDQSNKLSLVQCSQPTNVNVSSMDGQIAGAGQRGALTDHHLDGPLESTSLQADQSNKLSLVQCSQPTNVNVSSMDSQITGAGERSALTDYHLDGPLESTSLQADQSNKLSLVQCSQPTNVNVSSMDSQITGAGQQGALTYYHLDGPLESTSLQADQSNKPCLVQCSQPTNVNVSSMDSQITGAGERSALTDYHLDGPLESTSLQADQSNKLSLVQCSQPTNVNVSSMDSQITDAGERSALTDYHLDGPLESTSLQADQSNKLSLVQCSQPTNVNVSSMDGQITGAGERSALTDYHLDGPLESTSLQADQSNKLSLVQCSQPTNVNVSSMDSQITGAGQQGALTDYHLDGPLESTSLQADQSNKLCLVQCSQPTNVNVSSMDGQIAGAGQRGGLTEHHLDGPLESTSLQVDQSNKLSLVQCSQPTNVNVSSMDSLITGAGQRGALTDHHLDGPLESTSLQADQSNKLCLVQCSQPSNVNVSSDAGQQMINSGNGIDDDHHDLSRLHGELPHFVDCMKPSSMGFSDVKDAALLPDQPAASYAIPLVALSAAPSAAQSTSQSACPFAVQSAIQSTAPSATQSASLQHAVNLDDFEAHSSADFQTVDTDDSSLITEDINSGGEAISHQDVRVSQIFPPSDSCANAAKIVARCEHIEDGVRLFSEAISDNQDRIDCCNKNSHTSNNDENVVASETDDDRPHLLTESCSDSESLKVNASQLCDTYCSTSSKCTDEAQHRSNVPDLAETADGEQRAVKNMMSTGVSKYLSKDRRLFYKGVRQTSAASILHSSVPSVHISDLNEECNGEKGIQPATLSMKSSDCANFSGKRMTSDMRDQVSVIFHTFHFLPYFPFPCSVVSCFLLFSVFPLFRHLYLPLVFYFRYRSSKWFSYCIIPPSLASSCCIFLESYGKDYGLVTTTCHRIVVGGNHATY